MKAQRVMAVGKVRPTLRYTIVGFQKMLGIKLEQLCFYQRGCQVGADEASGRVRFDRKENHCPMASETATL
jgi:hypothetical protein